MIEALQLFEAVFTHGFILRVIDVNDLIFNTLGVVIGYLLLFAISKVFRISYEESQEGIKGHFICAINEVKL